MKVVLFSCLYDVLNGFLVNDCCVFGVEVLVIKVENRVLIVFIVKVKCDWRFIWKVEKFLELKDYLYFFLFIFDGWFCYVNVFCICIGLSKLR